LAWVPADSVELQIQCQTGAQIKGGAWQTGGAGADGRAEGAPEKDGESLEMIANFSNAALDIRRLCKCLVGCRSYYLSVYPFISSYGSIG